MRYDNITIVNTNLTQGGLYGLYYFGVIKSNITNLYMEDGGLNLYGASNSIYENIDNHLYGGGVQAKIRHKIRRINKLY